MSVLRIDLHTHSNRSDGTDPPAELVRRATAAGLDVLGLTDHDSFAGWPEARVQAARCGIRLIPGVEISCRLDGSGVHLLGYLPDPADADLTAELARVRDGRDGRVPAMLARLARHGLPLDLEDVTAQAREAVSVGRPHVADAMVAKGYVGSRDEAFDRWLAEGRPGYVTRYAPDPATAVRLVTGAGGAAVLAHPRGRAGRTAMTDERVAGLAAAGLCGLEVDHPDHDPPTREGLRRLARELDLVVTGASDHHGTGKVGHALGCCVTAPAELDRLLSRISRAVPGTAS